MTPTALLSKRKNYLLPALIIGLTVLVYLVSVSIASAQSDSPSYILEPDKKTLSAGDTLNLNVSITTGGDKVNSYEAHFSYPQDKLEFVKIDTSKSPYDMAIQSTGGDGKVTIIKGTPKAQTGKVNVGTITFKAKKATLADVVTVDKNSAIISATTYKNIMANSTYNSQNTSEKSMTTKNPAMNELPSPQKEGFISKIINSIKNFFSSLFK